MNKNITLKTIVLTLFSLLAITASLCAGASNAASSVSTATNLSTADSVPAATPDPCTPGWSLQAPYPPNEILSPGVVAQGNYLYSFGGYDGGTTRTNAYRYDGSAWSPIASLTQAAYGIAAASDGTYIYLLGGSDGGTSIYKSLTRYNPASNTYTMRATPTYSSALATATYVNGKIYFVGGLNGNANTSSRVQIYDIAANSWTTGTDYPIVTAAANAATFNGYIYVAGGISNTDVTNKTYRYNPNTDAWNDGVIDEMPQARGIGASGVLNGEWIVAGGLITQTGGFTETNSTIAWNPSNNTWTNLPDMPRRRGYNSGDVLGNAFYSIGGAGPDGQYHNENQRYIAVGCPTPTTTVMPTATQSITITPAPTDTPSGPTITPLPTDTPGGATNTPLPPTSTPPSTPTPSDPTPTDCPNPFVDLNGNIFYPAIHALYCRSVVGGIDTTHYGPAGTSTRAQFAKVVVLGFGVAPYTPSGGTQSFTDVAPSYFAYGYIETGYHTGILSGFDANTCATIGATFPCYGPNRPITRAQLTKLVVNAAGYPAFTPTTQTFSDVGPSNIFYASIETAHHIGVINGYPDNTFRPNNNIRRDEMAQIVYKAITTP